MANHFSALKRARQTEVRTQRNRASNSRLRTAIRKLRETIDGGAKGEAKKLLPLTASAIDKAVQKGVLHKNTAARYKKRLANGLNKAEKAAK